ncbi:hypothetical protein PLESTB_001233400 [Pleodorina starrii]|uniref:Uncharacterized protein n=1 Tax=Pleodorina starrii TaxID=330485 RepID=A0A9W6F6G3_9CHLO|nr:hypothetical protein PLESTB_001233400 [Pleodorina starrii]
MLQTVRPDWIRPHIGGAALGRPPQSGDSNSSSSGQRLAAPASQPPSAHIALLSEEGELELQLYGPGKGEGVRNEARNADSAQTSAAPRESPPRHRSPGWAD